MPRAPDNERRLALALKSVEVLEREGLAIPTERLALAVGVKRPTFLYYFPTQGHVIEAALVALFTEQASVVLPAIEAHTHPIDRLFAQMRAVHAFHRGRESRIVFLTQAIATIGGERGSAIVARGTAVFAAHRQAAADRVREGIRAGEVAPCDPDALVATMRALTDGLMVQRVTDGLELAPAHALVWEHLLLPLKRTPTQKPVTRTARTASKKSRAAPKRGPLSSR